MFCCDGKPCPVRQACFSCPCPLRHTEVILTSKEAIVRLLRTGAGDVHPYYQISLSPAVPKMELTAHLFCPHCQQFSTSVRVVKERPEDIGVFAPCPFSLTELRLASFENKSAFSLIWKSLLEVNCHPASPCHFRVLTKLLSPTSVQLLLVQLCSQQGIL